MRYLLFISILYSAVFADIHFKETRYMAALDLDRPMLGSLKFQDDNMIITYTKPTLETISYYDDKLTITNDDDTKEYSFEEYPQAQYMGLILKAILQDNYTSLDEFFEIKKENKQVILDAKASLYSTITYIIIDKDDKNNVTKIIINMSNKDHITIEIIN